ncbi:hypothetical protein [Chryseobacterium oryzae]|uniref:Uncharacterized protein n=1 Tax=Chryseobacterium oryzae TaxID=2929799 RepID=A0ABY4BD18_9FLAO|nr:hypothetical protein [Chryseobacterium oryzae]UOE37017.1 hypothetical protein MTP08_08025 [Chryseobacterium oryzae]
MKQNQIIAVIFSLFFNILFSNLYSQDLENEMFFNKNKIDYKFEQNAKIEKFFNKNSIDSIKIILRSENDSTFSVFIKNNLNKTLKLNPQDSSLYLIQEALDKNGKWNPIEFWAYSDCGNSYDNFLDFKNNQILHLTTNRYNGNFKTKVRVKLLMNKKNYYSNSITGKINALKFKKSTWYFQIKEMFYPEKSEKEAENEMFLNTNL